MMRLRLEYWLWLIRPKSDLSPLISANAEISTVRWNLSRVQMLLLSSFYIEHKLRYVDTMGENWERVSYQSRQQQASPMKLLVSLNKMTQTQMI